MKTARRATPATIVTSASLLIFAIVVVIVVVGYLRRADPADDYPTLVPSGSTDAKESGRAPDDVGPDRRDIPQDQLQPAATITVRVIDRGGVALQRVRVRWWDDSARALQMETDATGSCTVPARRNDAWLVAEAEAYASTTKYVDPSAKSVVLVLGEPAQIVGKLVLHEGRSPGKRLSVLAWPARLPQPNYTQARTLHLHDACALAGESDATGEFTIRNAKRDETYSLIAGGHGLSTAGTVTVTPGNALDDIPVYQVHAARVKLNDVTGHGISVPDVGDPRAPRVSMSLLDKTNVRHIGVRTPGMVLATDQLLGNSASWLGITALSARYGESLGGCLIDIAMPGFEPEKVNLSLGSVEQGIPTFEVSLRSNAAQMGEVSIQFTALPPSESSGGVVMLGTLQMRPLGQPSSRTIMIETSRVESEVFRCGLVPCGEYDVRYVLSTAKWAYPAATTPAMRVIVSPAGTVITIPVAEFGGVVFEATEDPVPWSHDERDVTMAEGAVSFEGESMIREPRHIPHENGAVIWGILPGEYSVWRETNGAVDNELLTPLRTQVRLGSVSRIALPVSGQ